MSISVEIIALALLHFLWQGALIGVLAAVALRALCHAEPRTRYALACACLLLMTLAPVLTAIILTQPAGISAPAAPSAATATIALLEAPLAAQPQWPRAVLITWLAGVTLFAARAIGGWTLAMRRLTAGRTQSPLNIGHLTARLGITRAVRLYESATATVPTTWGAIRPVILLPASAVLNVDRTQLEAILAHELAHIARHDFLVNCLQTVIEALLFYHPAVWWLSNTIRNERELCCDDIAASICGDRILYSRALLTLEEHRAAAANAPALAATGGHLKARIERLILPNASARPTVLPALLVAAALLTVAATVLNAWPQQQQQTPYEKWLSEDVAYIIRPEERAAFQSLTTDPERERFIEQFWNIRGTAAKEEHYRRIAYSNDRFGTPGRAGWTTDRGRIYIQNGPPAEIEVHNDQEREAWRYQDGRQFNFRGQNRDLVRNSAVLLERINLDRLPEPTRTRIREHLASRNLLDRPLPFTNEVMEQLRSAVAEVGPGLTFTWAQDAQTNTASLTLSDDPMPEPPAAPAPPPPPPPPAGAERVYRIGGGISAAVPTHKPEPQITPRARAAGIQGAVLLKVIINTDGTVSVLNVLRSLDPELDEVALQTVQNWRFRPAAKDGKPVAVEAHIELNFRP